MEINKLRYVKHMLINQGVFFGQKATPIRIKNADGNNDKSEKFGAHMFSKLFSVFKIACTIIRDFIGTEAKD